MADPGTDRLVSAAITTFGAELFPAFGLKPTMKPTLRPAPRGSER